MSNIASGSQDRPFAYLPTPSVGIVTRTKDRAVLLRRALESVKFQTYQNWKLVIVNDGGEPGPVDDLVAHVFQGDERVSIIHNPKSTGMEAASNAGLKSLSTDLAIIHDDDDSWAPEMLSVATQILVAQQSQFPQIRGVVTLINHVKETVTGNHVQVNSIKPWAAGAAHLEEGFIDLATLYNHNLFAPIAFLFDLNICKSLGLYDEALQVLGDWDFHQRYCSKYDIWIHPEYLAFYHHRAASTGALSNSGGNRHIYYRQLLKNKWLRESLADQGPSGAAAVLFREMAEKDIAGYHAPSFGGPPPRKSKYKSPLRAALSDWNRKRKAKRKA
ncbi:MAG: glycosyltransferase family A protein [Pseudomonadota bacterium]